MFDHLTRLHKQNRKRTASGVAISVLVHLALLALVLYGASALRGGGEAAGGVEGPGWQAPAGQGVSGGGEGDRQPPRAGSLDVALPEMLPAEALRAARIPPLLARLPDTLELGRPHPIRLALPRSRLPEDSVLRVRRGTGEVMTVQLSRARQATLHGEELVVVPQSPSLQLAGPRGRTEWVWSVTPREPGRRMMRLQLDAVARIDGETRVVTLLRADREVVVRATVLQRMSRFFARHWTWLSVLTLLAAGGWVRSVLGRAARGAP